MHMNDQITFVVQGAVTLCGGENITERCIRSINTFYPSSPIVLSTWECESRLDADLCSKVIFNTDPGPIPTRNKYLRNFNRMVVSTFNGISAVETAYAVKVRSDFWLTRSFDLSSVISSSAMVTQNPKLKNRILMCMTKNHYRLFPYYISDWFHFGHTSDLLKLWDIKLVSQVDLQGPPSVKSIFRRPFITSDALTVMDYHLHSEQILCLGFLRNLCLEANFPNSKTFFSTHSVIESYLLLGDIFAVVSRSSIGLQSLKHPVVSNRSDLYLWAQATLRTNYIVRCVVVPLLVVFFYLKELLALAKRYSNSF